MHKRYLTVIKNEDGLKEYDCGVEESANMDVYELPEKEFEDLCKSDVFKKINSECGLMIDDFESELLSIEDLKKCKKYMNDDVVKTSKVFNAAVVEATKMGVALGFDF